MCTNVEEAESMTRNSDLRGAWNPRCLEISVTAENKVKEYDQYGSE